MIHAACFLGNPGTQYAKSRHNLAWILIKYLHFDRPVQWTGKFKGLYGKSSIRGKEIFLLKPETYMNKSGESVQAFLSYFKIPPEELLVIHDDIELSFNEIQFKFGGGLAGHNGLKSLASSLGSKDFYRLRLGISRPERGSVSSYVLSRFSPEESAELEDFCRRAAGVFSNIFEKR